jgi:GntR family transcriptional regulator
MEFDANVPIYLQIIEYIKTQIVSNAWLPGDKLPSVRDLSETLKVNPNTIVRSYQELERNGITETRRGMGTYIREDEKMVANIRFEKSILVVQQFIQVMKENGFSNEDILSLVNKAISNEKK